MRHVERSHLAPENPAAEARRLKDREYKSRQPLVTCEVEGCS